LARLWGGGSHRQHHQRPPFAGINALDGAAADHGRFVPLQPVTFQRNAFSDNAVHLQILGGNDSRVVENTFVGADPLAHDPHWVAVSLSGARILMANNNVSGRPLGILLVSDERWPSPWPALSPATDARLVGNWFCDVDEPVEMATRTVSRDGRRRETCPVQPRFKPSRGLEPVTWVLLRAWQRTHGNRGIHRSAHWRRYNAMTLPILEYHDTNEDSFTSILSCLPAWDWRRERTASSGAEAVCAPDSPVRRGFLRPRKGVAGDYDAAPLSG
jgi:hypothetical protein